MNLEGNTVLVTGGSSGIGLVLAAELLARKNTVIVTGRNEAALAAARTKHPGLATYVCDVRDATAIAALRRSVIAEHPRLNVLINNAGIMRRLDLRALDVADITGEIDTNLSGTIQMVMQFLPHLRAQPRATIMNVTSGLAFVPFPIAPVYCATKAGLRSFTQSLRVQLKGSNITVVELAPPATETPMLGAFVEDMKGAPPRLPLSRLVDATMKGLASDSTEIRPGFSNLLKLLSRIAPDFALKQMSKSAVRMLAGPAQLER